MDITTISKIKNHFNTGVSSLADALIQDLITAYSFHFQKYLGRFLETKERTVYLDVEPNQRQWQLKAFPITTITSIHNDTTREFLADTLVTATDYYADAETGVLYFDIQPTGNNGGFSNNLPNSSRGVIKVVYTGGMASTTETIGTTDGFIDLYPDISKACDLQIAYMLQRRDSLGMVSRGNGGSTNSYSGGLDLLPEVKRLLTPYRLITA